MDRLRRTAHRRGAVARNVCTDAGPQAEQAQQRAPKLAVEAHVMLYSGERGKLTISIELDTRSNCSRGLRTGRASHERGAMSPMARVRVDGSRTHWITAFHPAASAWDETIAARSAVSFAAMDEFHSAAINVSSIVPARLRIDSSVSKLPPLASSCQREDDQFINWQVWKQAPAREGHSSSSSRALRVRSPR